MPCSTSCITAAVRYEFRDRAGAEQRALRIDRPLRRDIRIAVALLHQHFAVLDDDDDAARDVARAHRVGHEAIEPRLDVGARKLGGSGRIRGKSVAGKRPKKRSAVVVAMSRMEIPRVSVGKSTTGGAREANYVSNGR